MAKKAKKTDSKKTGSKKTAAKKPTKKAVVKKSTVKKGTKKKSVAKKTSVKKKISSSKPDKSSSSRSGINISSEERWRMIAVAAYHKAEKRGFVSGDENQDWLDAEKEVDEVLAGKNQ